MDQRADDDELEDRLCLALHHASHAMTAAYRTVLRPLDLTYPQYVVLSALWRVSPSTVKDLGDLLGSDYGTTSPLVRRLEVKALVSRVRSSGDEREVLVHLTEQGRALGDRAGSVQADVRRAVGLSDDDRARLVADLRRLAAQLDPSDG